MKHTALLSLLLFALYATACDDADTATNPGDDGSSSSVEGDDASGASQEEASSGDDAASASEEADAMTPEEDGEGAAWPSVDDASEAGDSGASSGTQWPNLVINEVAPAGAPADWVEILNRGDEDADLTGWALTDSDPEHVHTFESGQVLAPGAYLLLLKDDAGGFTFGLGNADSVSLYAPDGSLVDTTTWEDGASPESTSWGRLPNGEGDFMTLETPTPAGANAPNNPQECGNGVIELGEVCDGEELDAYACESFDFALGQLSCQPTCDAFDVSACIPPSREVVINEVSSSDDDRIELFNPGVEPVVMSGWTMSDENDEPTQGVYIFPAGSVLASGAYLVLQKDVHHLFGLGGNDAVKLRDAEGTLVDMMDWPKDGAEVSYCLIPNGGESAQSCEIPSFGGPND